jgi:hypothetical protein
VKFGRGGVYFGNRNVAVVAQREINLFAEIAEVGNAFSFGNSDHLDAEGFCHDGGIYEFVAGHQS